MSDLASDRRRVPRAVIADTELSVLAFPIPVRLLDISLGGVLREQLFGVSPSDPATLILVSVGLGAVALLACAIPARRAIQIEPMAALRQD